MRPTRILVRLPYLGLWSQAIEDTRYAIVAGVLYVVGCAIVCLLLGIGELQDTAARGPEIVKRIPYWNSNN